MTLERPEDCPRIEVVAGVLRDGRGRILLAERPPGKHLAGTWEFPGGKRHSGETAEDALARELAEELGIRLIASSPWMAVTHRYPEVEVYLQLHTVEDWRGSPRGLEGQSLRWVSERQMDGLDMPEADRPVVRALSLDPRYAITPDPAELGGTDAVLDWTAACLARGIRLVQLRAKSLEDAERLELAARLRELVADAGGRWLLNGSAEQALAAGADGVHLDGRRLGALVARPLPDRFLVAASCHGEADLARAGALGLDFVTLSPVRETASHPDAAALGWEEFGRLCRRSPLPVYALGGVSPDDLDLAREKGCFGVAGIRAFGAA